MLEGIKVLSIGGIGPGPFAAMCLADMGAEVIRVVRPGEQPPVPHDILYRDQSAVEIDLKTIDGHAEVEELIAGSHILIEGFRPGVMEKLGLGPDRVMELNPAMVYGRMTGWGQDGPLAHTAGHDINYLAVSGALAPIVAPDGRPVPPINFLGDFGGGAMYLVAGVLAALVRAQISGRGAVVDAAIVDGAAHLTAMLHSFRAAGQWGAPGSNLLDGGAPFYRVYQTQDGKWMAFGAIEPKFFATATRLLGLDIPAEAQYDEQEWPRLHQLFTETFAQRTRNEWVEVFAGSDACVSEVVGPDEVCDHPHLRARKTYLNSGGRIEPAPAPRFRDYEA